MKLEIIEKIKKTLRKKTYSEQDIVYFLVESYKFLEQEEKSVRKKFNVIIFYRNWACHYSLSKKTMEIFEKVYILIRAREYINNPLLYIDLINKEIEKSFSEYSFTNLENQIKKFSNSFLDKEAFNWKNLRIQLYNVIVDTPLIINRNKDKIFKFILKKIADKDKFDDLEIEVITDRYKFSFLLDDLSLNDLNRLSAKKYNTTE